MGDMGKEAAAAEETLKAQSATGAQDAPDVLDVPVVQDASGAKGVSPARKATALAAVDAQTMPGGISDVLREGSALSQALEISRYAVSCGFEWRDVQGVWEKVYEEIDEFKEAATQRDKELEFGDILFSLVNVARWSGVDPEAALAATCDKFRCRWGFMESAAKEKGQAIDTLGPEKLMELWRSAKRLERDPDQRRE